MIASVHVYLAAPEEHEVIVKADPQQHLLKRINNLERNLRKVSKSVLALVDEAELVDRCLLEQYNERVCGVKLDLFDVSRVVPHCYMEMPLSCLITRPGSHR